MATVNNNKSFAKHDAGWMPPDKHQIPLWLEKVIDYVEENPSGFDHRVTALRYQIERSPVFLKLFYQMFNQTPIHATYYKNPADRYQIRSYHQMLHILNHVTSNAPPWELSTRGEKGLMGYPFYAVFSWPMRTAAGIEALLDRKIDRHLKELADLWAKTLCSPESVSVLNTGPNGWLCPEALTTMADVANTGSPKCPFLLAFDEIYICDKTKPHYGFTSWDDFYTRKFREGIRPIDAPDDAPPSQSIPDPQAVIVNPCEARTGIIARNVRESDQLWIVERPYSVLDILHHEHRALHFIGGTVYEAFLDDLSYHGWHAPVSGTIEKIQQREGRYYVESRFLDPAEEQEQPCSSTFVPPPGHVTEVAARAIVYIRADNPAVGLMCAMFLGSVEESSCEVFAQEGQHVAKGDPIGTFHFGGAAYYLFFQRGVELVIVPIDLVFKKKTLRVNSALAVVKNVNRPMEYVG